MSDEDWRVEVRLVDSAAATRLHAAAAAGTLVKHVRGELGDRAVLSRDDNLIFAYATSRENAEAAQRALADQAAEEGLDATFTLTRFHPVAERWEDPDVPLPADDAARAAEAEEARETEHAESEASGIPEWEVRLTLPTHHAAVELAERLASEGIASQRHWHYLLLGAWSEAEAHELADRLRVELPDVELRVEGTLAHGLALNPGELRAFAAPFVVV